MSKKNNSIGDLYSKLQDITDWFEASDTKDVDEALKKYEEGQAVAKKLEAELKTLKGKITKIEADFS